MLPTSPLHALLFAPSGPDATPRFDLLIMTSGNRGGEPICLTPTEAHDRLGGIAEFFLHHDREISLRNDDSICVVREDGPQLWRRARGYAPGGIALHKALTRTVLAMGAELKNTIAVGAAHDVVLSPHVGDLEAPEAVDALRGLTETLPRFLEQRPQVVAVDLHPDMHATRVGHELALRLGIPVVPVQHHHAHAVACLAEHGKEEGLALVFDGTGLGPDGKIWGAELLEIRGTDYRRLATFAPAALPGGDAAVRQPLRQLVARWAGADYDPGNDWQTAYGISAETASVWAHQTRRALNAPPSHAAGRLFDAFASLIGVAPGTVTYEGQAAIRLEAYAARYRDDVSEAVPFDAHDCGSHLEIDWSRAFTTLPALADLRARQGAWALAFHHAVAAAACRMVEYALSQTDLRTVALSGGVFMNRILDDRVSRVLKDQGLVVLSHKHVPPNDGGIALGQAVIAGT